MSGKLLITGTSGQLGRLVVTHLLETLKIAPESIIATSRNTEALADFAARGVEVRKVDFEQPESLASAFTGADRLLLISTLAENRIAQHLAAIRAAEQAGVSHVLYTSLPGAQNDDLAIAKDHHVTEIALAESALPSWSVLRNNWYFENLDWTIPDLLKTGQWATANGSGGMAYISRSDLALAAAAALVKADGKNVYTLGGHKAWTTAEIAALVNQVFGSNIKTIDVSAEEIEAGMLAHGTPLFVAQFVASSQTLTARGGLGETTHDFIKLTGMSPETLEHWIEDHKSRLQG